MFHSGGGPLSLLFGILSSVFSVVAAAIIFAIVVGVLLLLVRFLWFGTRAAQLYLQRNGDSARFSWPVKPVGHTDVADSASSADAPGSPAAPAPAAAAAPAPSAEPAPAPSAAGPATTQETQVIPAEGLPTEVIGTGNAAPVPPRSPLKPKSPPSAE